MMLLFGERVCCWFDASDVYLGFTHGFVMLVLFAGYNWAASKIVFVDVLWLCVCGGCVCGCGVCVCLYSVCVSTVCVCLYSVCVSTVCVYLQCVCLYRVCVSLECVCL